MERYNTDTNLKPYQGAIIAVLGLLGLIFVAAPLQYNFGITGLILTELLMAVIAVIGTIAFKGKLKRVFPIRKIKLRQLAGIILLWIGTYLVAVVGTVIVSIFLPDNLVESGEAINNVINSMPFLSSIFVVAVMPGICEEMIMRGAVLSSFRTFKHKWMIILLVGIIFGIYHLDPVKLFSTAVLGMMLAYIVLETDNILLSMLFHCFNNAFAIVISFATANLRTAETMQGLELIQGSAKGIFSLIGSYMVVGCVVPFAIYFGARLIRSKERNCEIDDERKEKGKFNPVYIAAISTGVLFGGGCIVTTLSSML